MVNHLFQNFDFLYHFHTLFLFTKADIIRALVPQVCAKLSIMTLVNSVSKTLFALAVAPVCHPSHIPHVVAWIWLHLLNCNVANQVKAPNEDEINKPFRPLPSRRITEPHARSLRWILVPVCLAVSLVYSKKLFFTSLTLQVMTVFYNEFNGDESFVLKNSLTAAMYGCAGFGGALLAGMSDVYSLAVAFIYIHICVLVGCDRSHVPETVQLAVQLSTAVFASTMHAQDFKDVSGDRLVGRRTLPMVVPLGARLSIALGIPLWSICLSRVWHLDPLSAAAFVSYSSYTGARFLLYRSIADDKRSCNFYSVSTYGPSPEWLHIETSVKALV